MAHEEMTTSHRDENGMPDQLSQNAFLLTSKIETLLKKEISNV
jgi:hypothetical protein